jgi:hypothetical protein
MDLIFSNKGVRWGLAAILIAIGFPLLFVARDALFEHSPWTAVTAAGPGGSVRPAKAAFVDKVPSVLEVPAESCEGIIDTVNDKIPDPAGTSIDNVAAIYGWTAISTANGIVPRAVYLTITTDDGRHAFVATERASRPDLSEHFNQAALKDAGFRQTVDLSAFPNDFSIGVARVVEGRLEVCKNLRVRVTRSGG